MRGEMSRFKSQKPTWIIHSYQATRLNVKIDAMKHSMTLQFKQLAQSQAQLNMIQHTENWCDVRDSGTHDTKRCKENSDSMK